MPDTNSLIIEYSRNPANKYVMDSATIHYHEHNRVCADVVEVYLKIEDDRLKDFSFDGYMSIIATACTAIIGEALLEEEIHTILTLGESYIHEIIGTDISPRRRNASLIGLLATKNAIHTFLWDGIVEDFSDIML